MITETKADVTNSVQNQADLSTNEVYNGKRDPKLFRKRVERTRRGQLSVWEYRLGDGDLPDGFELGLYGRIQPLKKD